MRKSAEHDRLRVHASIITEHTGAAPRPRL